MFPLPQQLLSRLTKLSLLLVFCACTPREEKASDAPQLTKQQFTSVLIDLHKAEGMVAQLKLRRDSSVSLFRLLEDQIFLANGVEDSAYFQTLNWYMQRPVQFNTVYEAVIDSLNLEQRLARLDKEELDAETIERLDSAVQAESDSLDLNQPQEPITVPKEGRGTKPARRPGSDNE